MPRMYVKDEEISKTDPWIKQFRHTSRIPPPYYAKELWTKELERRAVYTEYRLKVILIEVFQDSIRQRVRHVWEHRGKPTYRRYAIQPRWRASELDQETLQSIRTGWCAPADEVEASC